MRLSRAIAAAGLLLSTGTIATAAQAQHYDHSRYDSDRHDWHHHDNGHHYGWDHGRHYGSRDHHRRCWSEYRRGEPIRHCY